jgi:hypothetical protein
MRVVRLNRPVLWLAKEPDERTLAVNHRSRGNQLFHERCGRRRREVIAAVRWRTEQGNAGYVLGRRLLVAAGTRDVLSVLGRSSLSGTAVQLAHETQSRLNRQQGGKSEADPARSDHLSFTITRMFFLQFQHPAAGEGPPS